MRHSHACDIKIWIYEHLKSSHWKKKQSNTSISEHDEHGRNSEGYQQGSSYASVVKNYNISKQTLSH